MASHRYTYRYRDKSGILKDGDISASSRADAFTCLKATGINPISLNATDTVTSSHPPHRGRILGYSTLLAVLVGSIWCVSLLLSEKEAKPRSSIRQHPIVKQKTPLAVDKFPAPKQLPIASSNEISTAVQNQTSKQEWKITEYRGQKVVGYTVTTNANGAILQRFKTADGNTHSIVTDPPPVFENSSDQILAMALSAPPGGELPPLPIPPTIERDFLASLSKPIVINEDDSDSVKKLKEDVIAARKEMQELLKSGRSAAEVLHEHQKLQNENTAIRNQVIKELRGIVDSGDVEGAEKYVSKMNTALEQMGIMGISMPKSAEARARRADKSQKVDHLNLEEKK